MAEYKAGPTIKISWVYGTAPGTITFDPDYRTFDFNQTVDVIDATAGADANKVKILGMLDATCTFTSLLQTGGTAFDAALIAGVTGTLTVQPEGTATNKMKIVMPAFSNGASYSFPYADIATASCSFSANAAYQITKN